MKTEDEIPAPEPPSPKEAWIILALLLLPGLVSIPAVYASMRSYGVGGLYALMLLTPVVSVIITTRIAKRKRRAGTPLNAIQWPLWFIGALLASAALSTGCCAIMEFFVW